MAHPFRRTRPTDDSASEVAHDTTTASPARAGAVVETTATEALRTTSPRRSRCLVPPDREFARLEDRRSGCLACGPILGLVILLGILAGAVAAGGQETVPEPAPRPRIETVQGRLVLVPTPGTGKTETEERGAAVERWLKRWRRETTDLAAARRRLARAVVTHHPTRLEAPCRQLGDRLIALDRERLLPAPDYAVHRHLTRHLDHLARAVAQCLVGHTTAAAAEMRRAARAESEVRLALGRWGLEDF